MSWNLAVIGQEAGLLGERPGTSGAGPTAGSGGSQGSGERVRGDGQYPTHSSPLQGLPGPAPLDIDLAGADPGAGWTPVLPTRYTPPSTHPLYPSHGTPRSVRAMHSTGGRRYTAVLDTG